MLYRSLERTGEQVSALGVGGHHLGDLPTVDEAIRLVHEAIDGGVTFFDNCWEYYNGKTENILGRALKGRRDKIFLMTKVCSPPRNDSLSYPISVSLVKNHVMDGLKPETSVGISTLFDISTQNLRAAKLI